MTRQVFGPDWAGRLSVTPLLPLAQLLLVGSRGSGSLLLMKGSVTPVSQLSWLPGCCSPTTMSERVGDA